jgi:hypothetical protein
VRDSGGFAQDTAKAPGPGKYNPTNPDKFKKKGAAYSMSARTYMPSGTSHPPLSLTFFVSQFTSIVALNEPRRRLKLRQSFLTRNDIVRIYSSADQTKKPGPGAHNPEKVYVNTKKAPSFSLGIRHSEYITPLIVDVPDI